MVRWVRYSLSKANNLSSDPQNQHKKLDRVGHMCACDLSMALQGDVRQRQKYQKLMISQPGIHSSE